MTQESATATTADVEPLTETREFTFRGYSGEYSMIYECVKKTGEWIRVFDGFQFSKEHYRYELMLLHSLATQEEAASFYETRNTIYNFKPPHQKIA
jgi:hypothetical protein